MVAAVAATKLFDGSSPSAVVAHIDKTTRPLVFEVACTGAGATLPASWRATV